MPPQAKLIYQDPEGSERDLLLTSEAESLIGRHPMCELAVSRPSVSRKHARFIFDGGHFYVEDLGSSNGTYVNNQRVTRAKLSGGDEVRCGDFELKFSDVADAGPDIPVPGRPPKPRVVGTIRPRRRTSDVPRRPDRESEGRPTVTAGSQGLASAVSAGPGPTVLPDSPMPRRQRRRTTRPAPVHNESSAEPLIARPSPPAAAPVPADLDKLREELSFWKAQAEAKSILDPVAERRAESTESVREIERLRKQLGEEQDKRSQTDQEVSDLRGDLDTRIRRIAELEAGLRRSEEQRETLTDRALRLKEQTQELQEQAEAYRREKVDVESERNEAIDQVSQLRQSLELTSGREAELVETVNDLKREVRQSEKSQKELEKQLDLAEYNLKNAREENENLRLALGEDGSARHGLNEKLDHVRQVVAEKEEIIDQLQADLSRAQSHIAQLEEDLRSGASGQVDQLQAELGKAHALVKQQSEILDANRRTIQDAESLRREIERLEEELLESEGRVTGAAPGRQVMQQLNDLRRANRDLKHEVEGLVGELESAAHPQGSADEGLRGELDEAHAAGRAVEAARAAAEQRVRALETELARRPSGASDGSYSALKSEAVELYESINDIASGLRMDIDLVGGYLVDLKPVVELITELPPGQLAPALREQVRSTVEEADAQVTMESAEDLLNSAQQSSSHFKRSLRKFREVLLRHGYGS